MVEPEFDFVKVHTLLERIRREYANLPVEILAGDRILEIRLKGVNQGLVVDRLPGHSGTPPLLVAIGDDRTDEDLFPRLPAGGIAIHVGLSPTRTPHRLPNVRAVRDFLWHLATAGRRSAPGQTQKGSRS